MPGLALLVFILVRLLASGASSGSSSQTSLQIRGTHLAWVLRVLLLGVAVGLALEGTVLLPLLLALAAYPTLLLEWVLVPAGIPGLAFVATRVLRPAFVGNENYSAAVFWELRARLRFGLLLKPKSLGRWSQRLFHDRWTKPRGASLAARAILDALAGDLDSARQLFNLGMNFRHSTYSIRAYCQAWLMADAARRGDYVEVRRLSWWGKRTWRARFMDACAARLQGEAFAAPLRLVCLWLLAPGRRASFGLLRTALRAAPNELDAALAPGFAAARDATVALLSAPGARVTRGRLRRLAVSWEQVLASDEVRARLGKRLSELDAAADASLLQSRFEAGIVDLLSDAWRRSRPEPASGGEPALLAAAVDQARSQLLDQLEPLVEQLPTGKHPSRGDSEGHHRSWAEIRALCERYLTLFPDEGGALYDSFGSTLLNHGSWLHNTELAYALARDVFAWLCWLAPTGHDDRELLVSNHGISLRAADSST